MSRPLARVPKVFLVVALAMWTMALASSSFQHGQYVLSADLGTESCRVGVYSNDGKCVATAQCPYASGTTHPREGWAEQEPKDWMSALQNATLTALQDKQIPSTCIRGVCIDTTACSVVALDDNLSPLRKCLLWCDARSAPQAAFIMEAGGEDESLLVNCAGRGPMSAEWMLPKSLWLKQNEQAVYTSAKVICEQIDYVNWRLTGEMVCSGCNTAARWNWAGHDRPVNLLKKVGLDDLLDKWPQRMVQMGELVGSLTAAAATELGLLPGTPVIQGGPDAYVGMVGLGAVVPKRLALMTGSSHLHLMVSDATRHGAGFWGSYRHAPLQGLSFAEGGQSSTGSLLQWAARKLFGGSATLAELDAEAQSVPIGAEGVLALETFQGSRTPVTDPLYRGAICGLSLYHTRKHIWRALLESICYGTRSCIEALAEEGLGADEIYLGGGAARSPFFLQMHADVTGLPVVTMDQENAPLLGGAVLAAAGCGLLDRAEAGAVGDDVLPRVRFAVERMVRVKQRLLPNSTNAAAYTRTFRVYQGLGAALRDTVHGLALRDGDLASPAAAGAGRALESRIAPSFLSADAGHLAQEAGLCAGLASWAHVDACDGGSMAPGALSSLGPRAVAAMRLAAPSLLIDVHLVHHDPRSLIAAFADAGATRLTLQLEQLGAAAEAEAACRAVRRAGMACGLCLAPLTPAEALDPLAALLSGPDPVVEFVDILAVHPGVAGQSFDDRVLPKLTLLREKFPTLKHVGIDGGVDALTISRSARAGANFFIAGSAIFGPNRRVSGSASTSAGVVAANLAKLARALDIDAAL